MADDADALSVETAEAADHRFVLAEFPVAGEGDETSDKRGDVIETMRTLRMTRDLGLLPGREVLIDVFECGGGLGIAFASLGSGVLVNLISSGADGSEAIALDLGTNWRVLAFTTLVTVTTTLLIGSRNVIGFGFCLSAATHSSPV